MWMLTKCLFKQWGDDGSKCVAVGVHGRIDVHLYQPHLQRDKTVLMLCCLATAGHCSTFSSVSNMKSNPRRSK